MRMPTISILMPVYNCAAYIREAINSMLEQTLSDFELIIIDDASTDATPQIISSYDDERIQFVQKPVNTGLIASLNQGIDIAKGKYLARMDGDDISHPDRLARQVAYMEAHPSVVLCGSYYEVISTSEIIEVPCTHAEIKRTLLEKCAFQHPTVMMKRSFMIDHQLRYNEGYKAAEDYELWSRIVALGEVANLSEVLLYYRRHHEQVSTRLAELQYQNTLRCQAKMLCMPLSAITERDLAFSQTVVQNLHVSTRKKLNEVLGWLNSLAIANKHSLCFQDFETYLQQQKIKVISKFFKNRPLYNMSDLPSFFKLSNQYTLDITLKEKIIIIIKNLIFWRSRAL